MNNEIKNLTKAEKIRLAIYNNLVKSLLDRGITLQMIFDYYKNHTIHHTATHFGLASPTVKSLLIRHNIELHSKQFNNQLSKALATETNLVKYGVANPAQNAEIREKAKVTCIEKYGVEHFNNFEKTKSTKLARYGNEYYTNREKNKQTCMERYGVEFISQSTEFKNNLKNNNLKKYGVEWVSQTPEWKEKVSKVYKNKSAEEKAKIRFTANQTNLARYGIANYNNQDKIIATNLERYGVKNVFQLNEVKDKIHQTNLEKYGKEQILQVESIRDKAKQTCLNKYGAEFYVQTIASTKFRGQKFKADNICFDSFPELCFYLFHKEHGLDIKRCPTRLEYYYNNKKHYYFPDFEVDGNLVEIKSDYLYKQLLIPNSLDNAKYQCMLQNNIEILKSEEYKKYIKWFHAQGYEKEDFKYKR